MISDTERLGAFVSYNLSATNIMLKQLVECLENNGALRKGQFQQAIQATIDYPGAPKGREDYRALAGFLALFEKAPSTH